MGNKFIIIGGEKLKGEIEVRGAKNAALKIFAAALLTIRPVTIKNVPEVEDIVRISELLTDLGVKVEHLRRGEYRITARKISGYLINPEFGKKLRASIVMTGPMLARLGKVQFSHPGGCVIGERPIDVFLDGYKALGAKISTDKKFYNIKAKKLRGAKFVFNTVSVTGTESMIMAASLAKGKTLLKNCACEPEIESLANFLNQCGAKIQGAGTPFINIEGVNKLDGGEYVTIPDRIETGSFAILAAASGSDVLIKNCEPEHLDSLWNLLRKAGVRLKINKTSIRVSSSSLKSVDIKTHEYPGFPTDLQAPACVLLTQSRGHGLVHETIYEGRLMWTEELKRMGADIHTYDPHRLEVKGPTALRGRKIESPDIRAGMAYLIAALIAKGKSEINNVYQIDRGYEKIEERLKKIGANIKRV